MNKHISLTIDGQSVSGTITDLSRSGISIEISTPFSGYSAHRYVPTFARAHRNYLEIGEEVAAELLTGLYHDLCLLNDKRHSLTAAFEKTLSQLSQCKTSQAESATKKPELKRQFREGLLDQKQYQRALKDIRDKDQQQSTLAREIVSQFIDDHLTGWNYGLDHDQLIAFLSSN